jgi:MFS family permease
MLEPLRNPSFRWLFSSNLAFFFAMGSQQVVRAWLAYDLTGSEFALGMTMLAAAVPMFFIAPIGGVVADRLERRNVIMAGQAVACLSQAVVLLLIVTDTLLFWHLIASAFVMGSVFPFIMPARQAIVVNIVGRDGLTGALALSMAGMNATRIVGPAAGGFLISFGGVDAAYTLGVLLFLLSLVFMLLVERSRPLPREAPQTLARGVQEGFHYVRDQRLILVLLGFGLIPMFLAMPFQNLLVVFAEKVWATGSVGLGILSSAAGVGGMVGAIWVASLGERARLSRMMLSVVLFGVLLLIFSYTPWFWPAVGIVFVANIFASAFQTLNNTAIQLLIPDEVRGRISAFLMMSFSLPLLGTAPISALAEIYGAPFAVGTAAVGAVVVAIAFYVGSPVLRSLDREIVASGVPPA